MSVDEQIKEIVSNNQVVLFMKGTRMFPQCGFSARSVELLKACGVKKFKDVNVLTDPGIRQGIKDFSNWPTIPQCYIDGKFVGGSDILIEMYESGELHQLLGAERPDPASITPPKITITDKAKAAFAEALKEAGDDVLRFDASASFAYDLYFGPKEGADLVSNANGIAVHVSAMSAERLDGATIDFVDGKEGAGFKIDNPNEPASVKTISPKELQQLLDEGKELHLFDVRSDKERAVATIAGARPFDPAGLADVAKNAMLVFHCHHGIRSRSAAQQVLADGFTQVYNLTGGIDAWSLEVDDSVARY